MKFLVYLAFIALAIAATTPACSDYSGCFACMDNGCNWCQATGFGSCTDMTTCFFGTLVTTCPAVCTDAAASTETDLSTTVFNVTLLPVTNYCTNDIIGYYSGDITFTTDDCSNSTTTTTTTNACEFSDACEQAIAEYSMAGLCQNCDNDYTLSDYALYAGCDYKCADVSTACSAEMSDSACDGLFPDCSGASNSTKCTSLSAGTAFLPLSDRIQKIQDAYCSVCSCTGTNNPGTTKDPKTTVKDPKTTMDAAKTTTMNGGDPKTTTMNGGDPKTTVKDPKTTMKGGNPGTTVEDTTDEDSAAALFSLLFLALF